LKLFEHEAKNLLRQHGISIPKGELAATSDQALEAIHKLKPPFVIKAQLLIAGRGKAGGIQFALNAEDAKSAAKRLLWSQIKGFQVKKVLVEEKVRVKRELYFAMTLDRTERSYGAIASSKGGVDIELTATKMPASVIRTSIDPTYGFRLLDARKVAGEMGFGGRQQGDLAMILKKLCQIGIDLDAILIEVNPIAETPEGTFVVLDSRLIIDDNALFRHPEFEKLQFEKNREHTEQEIEAMKNDIAYVKLEGEVGIIGNGAGLVMATLDMVKRYGGKPANFLDLGGGAPTERIAKAIKIVMSDPSVKVVFINILGGLTRCDDVARAILNSIRDSERTKPIVIRLVGTNEAEGKHILSQAGLQVLDSMEEAAKQASETVNRKSG